MGDTGPLEIETDMKNVIFLPPLYKPRKARRPRRRRTRLAALSTACSRWAFAYNCASEGRRQ